MQSQEEIRRRIAAANPEVAAFVKDQPILGWRLDGDALEDLPGFVRDHLGSVDATDYDPTYFRKNRGSIVALQMADESPDFYIVGKSTYEDSYVEVSLDEVAEKNDRLVQRLQGIPELWKRFRDKDPRLVGALKTEPVEMIRMSDIGYDRGEEITIDSPWGRQTKPAATDAFLVREKSEGKYYMVIAGDDDLPLNYVPTG